MTEEGHCLPLHPMSTSIPNTYQPKNKRQKISNKKQIHNVKTDILENTQYYQLIPRMQYSVNGEHLRRHCEQSLLNICALYDIPLTNSVIESLQQINASSKTPHNTLLALFFMLFNLDLTLKDQMLQAEPAPPQLGTQAGPTQACRACKHSCDSDSTNVCMHSVHAPAGDAGPAGSTGLGRAASGCGHAGQS